jgi:hypothetical protein
MPTPNRVEQLGPRLARTDARHWATDVVASERRRRPFYRDWIRPHEGFMATDSHRSEFAINSALDKAIDGVDEIIAMKLRMEAENRTS